MQLFSPDRPKLPNGYFMFVPNGEPLNVLPGLYMFFTTPGIIELSCFPSTSRNRATRLLIELPLEALPGFITSWLEDPESVIINTFGWKRASLTAPPTKLTNINLEDLDLNF